jgi:hypothetical protein
VSLQDAGIKSHAWYGCRDVEFKTVSYESDVDAEEIEERADEHPSEVDF